MKETGIIFSTPLIPGLLDGSITQTRRTRGLDKFNENPDDWKIPVPFGNAAWIFFRQGGSEGSYVKCPYGQVGDRLWCKEKHCIECYKQDGIEDACYPFDEDPPYEANDCSLAKWRSPMFMPRWASRILLEITEVRVERLQEITVEDAIREGVRQILNEEAKRGGISAPQLLAAFATLWDSINAKKYPWSRNPWVWVLGLRRVNA